MCTKALQLCPNMIYLGQETVSELVLYDHMLRMIRISNCARVSDVEIHNNVECKQLPSFYRVRFRVLQSTQDYLK